MGRLLVIAPFVAQVLHQYQKGRHPQRQAQHIDQAKRLVLPEAAEGNLEYIFKHGAGILNLPIYRQRKCQKHKHQIIKIKCKIILQTCSFSDSHSAEFGHFNPFDSIIK
jgi:hypothetical protein